MELAGLIISVFLGLALLIYSYLRRQQQFWRRNGIPVAPEPHPLFGNVSGIGRTAHTYSLLQGLYRDFKRRGLPIGGFMNFFQPAILVVDPEVSKNVLVRDFNVFHDRGIFVDTIGDPVSAGLFSLEGVQWKVMRQKLSPTFTSGKMKYMFSTVLSIAQELKAFMVENCHREDLEVKNILQRFTMDVIGNVAFGIECNTIRNPNTEFSRMGNKSFEFDTVRLFKLFVGGKYRTLAKMIGMKVVPKDVSSFFMELAKSTVYSREINGTKRNDFMSLLLEIRSEGKFLTEPNSGGEGLTMGEIAAQCLLFFNAGFETSSSTMNFCLYELAMNPDLQEKLRIEIEESIAKDNGEIIYDTVIGMDLLERVVNETLRKYPPVDNLFRVSNAQYTFPNTAYTIPAGTFLQIPVYAMHHDPQYFPEPEQFKPDRFLPEAVKSRHPYVYLPFGEGPRNCIGLRFGLMQTKIGLITLLRSFRFSPNKKTLPKLEFDPALFVLSPKTGMYLNIEPL
ncbi:probable cytochrome P450 6a14 [Toxorhynchites rutilus septentrionalis]|uniref:probable cytochrome P450 6a14 n=1 Tax=Toxorhynchites rutilus septentrionalis TaxID=329112 RepID=UPI00247AF319|nr:probable cytochrome P450 6a14 [Toxorhynchites rutilus septentrionalis]